MKKFIFSFKGQNMLELYNFSQSTCSQKVRVCLHEKGLEWTNRLLKSDDQKHLEEWYLKLNPNGVVPTLLHDDNRAIFESSAIMEYLEDAFPATNLRPTSNNDIAQMRAWISFVDHITTPAVRYPSFQYGGLLTKFKQLSQDDFDSKIGKRPLKSNFYKEMDKNKGFPLPLIRKALLDIKKSAARISSMLEESGGSWILGEQFTLCDVAIGPLFDRIEDLGLEYIWTSEMPLVTKWLSQFQKRPSVIKTFYDGSRLSEMFPSMKLGKGSKKELVKELL